MFLIDFVWMLKFCFNIIVLFCVCLLIDMLIPIKQLNQKSNTKHKTKLQ